MASPETATPRRPVAALIAGWVGLLAQVATVIWYLASRVIAPVWAVGVLLVIWCGLLALAVYLLRTRPVYTLLVPIASAAILYGAIFAGQRWLCWTG